MLFIANGRTSAIMGQATEGPRCTRRSLEVGPSVEMGSILFLGSGTLGCFFWTVMPAASSIYS